MRSDRLCHAVEHTDHHTLLNPGFGRSDGGATRGTFTPKGASATGASLA